MAGGHRVLLRGRHRVHGPERHAQHLEPRGRAAPRLQRGRDLWPAVLAARPREPPIRCRGADGAGPSRCCTSPGRDTVLVHKNGRRDRGGGSRSRSSAEPTGAPTGVSAVLRDITERKRAERELRRLLVDGQRRERWLGAISEVRLSMLAGGGLEQWLALIARRVSELSDADGATISVVAEDDDSLLEVHRHPRVGGPSTPRPAFPDRGLRGGTGLHLGPLVARRRPLGRALRPIEPTPSRPGSAPSSSSRSRRCTGPTACWASSGWRVEPPSAPRRSGSSRASANRRASPSSSTAPRTTANSWPS